MLPAGWPKSQRLTLDTAKVVALVSMDANNLMVLCVDKVLMISGTLGTVVPSAGVNTSSFSVRTIASDVGCIDEDSIQRTPYGVVFASRNGVYLTDGTTFTNIMVDKIQNEWNVYQYDQSNSVCGSAVLGDTHYVLFTVKGPHFICDMPNDFAWTKMSVNPDIDGNVTIALDAKSQATYTLGASSSYIPSARYYGGSAGTGLDYGMLVSSVSLGGDLWVQKTVSSGAAMTQITGVTTDTTTDRRDIGVANNATRVVIPTVSGGTCSIRVYTISGSVATLEQSLSAPATKTFSTSMNVDMSAAGDIVVAKLTDGFAIYERSGTTWSLATSFVLASATATISGDGSTIAVSSGATIYLYTKTGGVWSLSTSFGYAAPNLTSFNLGGNNLSIAYDATWVAGIGVYGTTTKFAVWRKTGVNSWSAAGLVSLATLSVYRYDSIGINVNGYVALNRYLASGFTANNSDAMLYKYDSLSNSYVLSRNGFSTGKSGIGGASIGWDSSGSNLNNLAQYGQFDYEHINVNFFVYALNVPVVRNWNPRLVWL